MKPYLCPFCKSGRVRYCEDVEHVRDVRGILDDGVIVVDSNEEVSADSGSDERLWCEQCGREWTEKKYTFDHPGQDSANEDYEEREAIKTAELQEQIKCSLCGGLITDEENDGKGVHRHCAAQASAEG